jgi:uracil-DNA glycosylase
MQANQLENARRILIGRLESLHGAGVLQLPRAVADLKDIVEEGPDAPGVAKPPVASSVIGCPQPISASEVPMKKPEWASPKPADLFEAGNPVTKEEAPKITLEVLRQEVAGCTRCAELASTRTQTVFGVGNPNARLCFLGEAPGADEDRTGEPFVGRGGQLLTKIIEACRLKREDVYIVNMIKCRPPGNRNPLPTELSNCRGYLERQLDLIQPEFICCLGAVASQNLLSTTVAIGKLRGKIHSYRGAKVVCTYHPAFLLRSPAFKKETWEDMKLLMREMGVEL